DAGAVDDAGEDVAADVVIPEPVFRARCRPPQSEVAVDRVVGCDPRRKEGQDHEKDDEQDANESRLVIGEPAQRPPAWAQAAVLLRSVSERGAGAHDGARGGRLLRFPFGNSLGVGGVLLAHWTRTRGSMKA